MHKTNTNILVQTTVHEIASKFFSNTKQLNKAFSTLKTHLTKCTCELGPPCKVAFYVYYKTLVVTQIRRLGFTCLVSKLYLNIAFVLQKLITSCRDKNICQEHSK